MLIEFIGMPGSGKSSLARGIAATSGTPVVKANGWVGTYRSRSAKVRAVLRHRTLAFRAMRLSGTHRMSVSRSLNLCRRHDHMRSLGHRPTLIEDGPLFALCRIVRERDDISEQELDRVVDQIAAPDVCVVVRTRPETSLFRLANYRGGGNATLGLDEKDGIELLERHARAMDQVISSLRHRTHVVEVVNDEDGALQDVLGELRKQLPI